VTDDGSRRRPSVAAPLEAEVLRLAAAIGLCTARARLDMPALPVAAVHRCADAAAVLDHAARLLLSTLLLEEMAADERQGVCLDCGAPLPRPEAWGYCDGCGFTEALRPATLDHPDHREPGEEP
jgi:hypothetical protein